MNHNPTFYAVWQLHGAEETVNTLLSQGHYAEVFCGHRYGDQPNGNPPGIKHPQSSTRGGDPGMSYPYVLTTAPAEVLEEARIQSQALLPGHLHRDTHPASLRQIKRADFAWRQYEAWSAGRQTG